MLESESLCLNRMTSYSQAKISKGITLWPLIAATYFMVSGGPYGLEDVAGELGTEEQSCYSSSLH